MSKLTLETIQVVKEEKEELVAHINKVMDKMVKDCMKDKNLDEGPAAGWLVAFDEEYRLLCSVRDLLKKGTTNPFFNDVDEVIKYSER